MKYIQPINKFITFLNEAFLHADKKKAIDIIISYIKKNSKIDLYEYDETWHIQKEDVFLKGQLFVSLKFSKAIRFNWIEGDLNSQIHSIDMWNDFSFDTKPDFTLEIGQKSITKSLPQILSFIKEPDSLLEELTGKGDYDPREELERVQGLLKRARSAKTRETHERRIEQLKSAIAMDERAEIDSGRVDMDDLKIDIFKSIELYTIQVARGKSNSLIVSGQTGVGKCHGKGTKILMYDGSIKNVEDIEVGEFLMGDDSTPRKILSLGRGKDKIYEIKSKGWDNFTVNSEHILVIKDGHNKKISEITVKDFLDKGDAFKKRSQLLRTGVEFKSQDIKMDPYLLGIWLGDGARTSPFGIETCDIEIVNFLEEKALNYNLCLKLHENKKSKSDGYYFSSGSKGKGLKLERNEFINELKFYKLYNCTEKFIPSEYLINSVKIREKLLAGLIDSDGYQFHKSYSICTKWIGFANQIVFLCRSLGFKSHVTSKFVKEKEYYTVNISGDLSKIPVKLERKMSECRKQIKGVLNSGFTISEIDYNDYYGFEIDGNHRYLLGDFTITHNTQVVKDTLSSLGMEKDKHYYFATGTATTAGLYEIIFKNRNKLIVFDDCDDVFKEPDSNNLLKGALDTYPVREISKLTKGNTFDSTGMSDSEIEEEYDIRGKVPNRFEFI